MSAITKERVANLLQFNSEGSDCQANAEQWEVHELARIALASLEAEPVAWTDADELRDVKNGGNGYLFAIGGEANKFADPRRQVMIYTAPPSTVSVPDELSREEYKRRFMEEDNFDDTFRGGWSACRAAMLQGADCKPELTVWYGSMPETNGKTNWTAMLHRKGKHPWEGITIDRSEYPDRVRYEADRMRHLIGELPEEPDILEYDADAHSGYVKPGNSPVIPDGWVMVPVEPTLEMIKSGANAASDGMLIPGVYRAMLSAAPQQEVK